MSIKLKKEIIVYSCEYKECKNWIDKLDKYCYQHKKELCEHKAIKEIIEVISNDENFSILCLYFCLDCNKKIKKDKKACIAKETWFKFLKTVSKEFNFKL